MNIIFLSPHFPKNCTKFCYYLKNNGANVLGIGDTDYYSLSDTLKQSLTEYYKIDNMENYDEVLRAVGYYTHIYGKINRFESLNEHWLELEAKIRTDFNIVGTKLDFIHNLKLKSKMREFFQQSGVKSIESLNDLNRGNVIEFVAKVGYPIVVKPDQGSGSSMTYKISNDLELEHFLNNKPSDVDFIMQQYIDGFIQTYDGLVDQDGQIVFAASHEFPNSIMDVVNSNNHLHYFCLKEISPDVEEVGRKILKTYDVRERFFHIELFKSNINGEIIALEVNMRPPGTWMTHAINFSYDMNIFKEWANMVVYNQVEGPHLGKYYTGFASRKNHIKYVYNHDEILYMFRNQLVNYGVGDDYLSRSRGNYAFQFRSTSLDEVKEIVKFIHETE